MDTDEPTPKTRITIVIGTRPELIKLAPVVHALRRRSDRFHIRVVLSGQHKDLIRTSVRLFDLRPDVTLESMSPGQSLSGLTIRLLEVLGAELRRHPADVVIGQGDTTTALVAALCAFYAGSRFAHVEAGLRTHDKNSPFPEEMNRRLIGTLADIHFAPTALAKSNLVEAGVPEDAIRLVGNTCIDALLWTLKRTPHRPLVLPRNARMALLTLHRRENWGAPMERILRGINDLTRRNERLHVVFPLHPNPKVRRLATSVCGSNDRVHLLEPLEYDGFVGLMNQAEVILTDSGGVQEEAPTLGVPVLVLRENTERPEGVAAGAARLVGTRRRAVVAATERVLNTKQRGAAISRPNPYGDGNAAERIVKYFLSFVPTQGVSSPQATGEEKCSEVFRSVTS